MLYLIINFVFYLVSFEYLYYDQLSIANSDHTFTTFEICLTRIQATTAPIAILQDVGRWWHKPSKAAVKYAVSDAAHEVSLNPSGVV